MGFIDIVCIVLILVWFILGLKRGILHELLRLAALVICFILAYFLLPFVCDVVSKFVEFSDNTKREIFAVVFLLVTVLLNAFSSRTIDALGEMRSMGILNRFFGGVVSVVGSSVYLWALLTILSVSMADDSYLKKQANNGVIAKRLQYGINFGYEKANKLLHRSGISDVTLEDIEVTAPKKTKGKK